MYINTSSHPNIALPHYIHLKLETTNQVRLIHYSHLKRKKRAIQGRLLKILGVYTDAHNSYFLLAETQYCTHSIIKYLKRKQARSARLGNKNTKGVYINIHNRDVFSLKQSNLPHHLHLKLETTNQARLDNKNTKGAY